VNRPRILWLALLLLLGCIAPTSASAAVRAASPERGGIGPVLGVDALSAPTEPDSACRSSATAEEPPTSEERAESEEEPLGDLALPPSGFAPATPPARWIAASAGDPCQAAIPIDGLPRGPPALD